MRVRSVAAAFVLGTAVLGTAAPAHAAYPESSFYIAYGNSYTKGTVTWYNRSVGINYAEKAASDCRQTAAYAQPPNAWGFGKRVCAPNSTSGYFNVETSSAGGYYSVLVQLRDDAGNILASDLCYNGDAYCSNV